MTVLEERKHMTGKDSTRVIVVVVLNNKKDLNLRKRVAKIFFLSSYTGNRYSSVSELCGIKVIL